MSVEQNGLGISLHNLNSFVSTGRVGTGSSESVAHNIGETPRVVIVVPHDSTTAWSIGASDYQNVNVTVANGDTYDLIALL